MSRRNPQGESEVSRPKGKIISNEPAKESENSQRSIEFLPTGSNVKIWSTYGEAATKALIIYVS